MTIITIPKADPIYNTVVSMGGNPTDYLITNPVNTFVSTAFTIEFWMLANPQNTGTILSYSLTNESSIQIVNPQNINIYVSTLQTTPTGVSFVDTVNNLEEWHYFTLTWSSLTGALILYKDGVVAFTTILAQGTVLQPAGSLVVGQNQTQAGVSFANPYKGKIIQFRIWDNVRPPYFIQQDMKRNVFGNSNLAIWQMPSADVQLNYISSGTYLDNNVEVPILVGVNTYPTMPALEGKPPPPSYPMCISTDNGKTWTDAASSNWTFAFIAYQGNNVIWASATGNNWILFSNDNGTTWSVPANGSFLVMMSAVAGFMIGLNAKGYMYSTVNNGVSYTQLSLTATYLWVCVVSATNIYAISPTNQLLYSTNGGTAFTQITTIDIPVTQVEYDNGVLVVLTTAGNLIYSQDNATTWQPLISNTLTGSIQSFTVQNGVIYVVNGANQVLMTTINMNMVVNWQLNEGYGCYGFDYSGNDNNGRMGGCMAENDEEAWEISTRIEAPQFIEGANDLVTIIASRVSREIAAEAVAKKHIPVVGKALLAARKIASEAALKKTPAKKTPAPKKAIKKTKKR